MKYWSTSRYDGLICDFADKWNLVDWPENMRDGYDFPLDNPIVKGKGVHNVINAFLYRLCYKNRADKGNTRN